VISYKIDCILSANRRPPLASTTEDERIIFQYLLRRVAYVETRYLYTALWKRWRGDHHRNECFYFEIPHVINVYSVIFPFKTIVVTIQFTISTGTIASLGFVYRNRIRTDEIVIIVVIRYTASGRKRVNVVVLRKPKIVFFPQPYIM